MENSLKKYYANLQMWFGKFYLDAISSVGIILIVSIYSRLKQAVKHKGAQWRIIWQRRANIACRRVYVRACYARHKCGWRAQRAIRCTICTGAYESPSRGNCFETCCVIYLYKTTAVNAATYSLPRLFLVKYIFVSFLHARETFNLYFFFITFAMHTALKLH